MAGVWGLVSFWGLGITAVRIAAFGCMAFSPFKNICSTNVGEGILLVDDSCGTSAALLLLSSRYFGCAKLISAIGAGRCYRNIGIDNRRIARNPITLIVLYLCAEHFIPSTSTKHPSSITISNCWLHLEEDGSNIGASLGQPEGFITLVYETCLVKG